MVRVLMCAYLNLPLDERPPPKERLDPLDNEPGELGRGIVARTGKPSKEIWRVRGPDPMTQPRDRGADQLGLGVALPEELIGTASLPNIRPAVVRDVHELAHDLARDYGQHVVGLDNGDRELCGFVPTVGTNATQGPGKDCAPQSVGRAERNRAASQLSTIPEPTQLEEKQRMNPKGESVIRMGLAEIPQNNVQMHCVPCIHMGQGK